jgi:hypothetical protein
MEHPGFGLFSLQEFWHLPFYEVHPDFLRRQTCANAH